MLDCFDGCSVGYRLKGSPELAVDTPVSALEHYRPDPTVLLTIHSDRGSQYRTHLWVDTIKGKNIIRSMSRKGNSGDNAACEGFSVVWEMRCSILSLAQQRAD